MTKYVKDPLSGAMVPERYAQKDSWPHAFTRSRSKESDGREWQEMICTHCHKTYLHGKEPKPAERCPARNDKRELRRLQG